MKRRARTRNVLLVVALAAIAGLPRPVSGAAADTGSGTTATSEGGGVVITVRIDVCCAANANQRVVFDRIVQNDVTQAEAEWNRALGKLPYRDCYPIKVAFRARLLNKGDKPSTHAHQIKDDFVLAGRGHVNVRGDVDPTLDTAAVYKQPVTGELFESVMSVRTWAHEFGHLMGLGDDYRDGPDGKPVPLKETRRGTLMAGGTLIDQDLADRLGHLAADAGLKLPGCWSGTLHAKSSQIFGSGAQCVDEEWDIKLNLVVLGDGSVTGQGSGPLVSMPKCTGMPADYRWGYEFQGRSISSPGIRGKFDGKEFQLQFPAAIPDEPHGTLGGILSLSGEPPGQNTPTLRVPVTAPGIASGQTRTDVIIGAAPRHGVGVFDIELKQKD